MIAVIRDPLVHFTTTHGPSSYFKKLPTDGKACECIRRVATAAACVFAYIALGAIDVARGVTCLIGRIFFKNETPKVAVDHPARFERFEGVFVGYISNGYTPINKATIFVSNGVDCKEFSVQKGDIGAQIKLATKEIKEGAKDLPFQWYACVQYEGARIATYQLLKNKDGSDCTTFQYWAGLELAEADFQESVTRFTARFKK